MFDNKVYVRRCYSDEGIWHIEIRLKSASTSKLRTTHCNDRFQGPLGRRSRFSQRLIRVNAKENAASTFTGSRLLL